MSDIFEGQDVELNATITENGVAVPITGGTVVFEYYLPGNTSSVKDGDYSGTIVSGPDGTVTGTATAVVKGSHRVQAAVTLSGKTYRAKATCFTVKPLGTGCSS